MNTSKKSTKVITLTNTQKPFLERNDNLTRYYADIRDYDLLDDAEVKALLEERSTATPERREEIKNYIFEHNARIVVSLARKFCTSKDNLNDLIEEGNIGLLNAIEKYDASKAKNGTFTSFALLYIRREINTFRSYYTDMVYRTNHVKTDMVAKNITSDFLQKNGRVPTTEELLTIYNKSQKSENKKISDHKDLINVEYVYIDNLESNDGEFTDCQSFIDYSNQTASTNDYYKEMNYEYNHEHLSILMKCLNDKEKRAIRLMYGLETGFEESLSSIGLKLGCSSERARQLCATAIEKMQNKAAYAK